MKGFNDVPDLVENLEPDGEWQRDTKNFFDTYHRDRIDKATKYLIDFLVERGALQSDTRVPDTFRWIEREKPRPGARDITDRLLLRRIALVYTKLAEPEDLADRLSELALDVDDTWQTDPGQVFLNKLITLIYQGKAPPDINDVNIVEWSKYTYHLRESVSHLRKGAGIKRTASFVRGVQPSVQAAMRDLLRARRASKEDRMERTAKVKEILHQHTKLRSADRDRIAGLVGFHFGDEMLPRSEEAFINRLKRREERRRRSL